jgi:hypothetical protein
MSWVLDGRWVARCRVAAPGVAACGQHGPAPSPWPRTQRQRASDDSCCTAPLAALGAVECVSRLECVGTPCRLPAAWLRWLAGERDMILATIPRRSQRRDAQIPEAALPPQPSSTPRCHRCEMRDLGCGGGFCALGRRGAPRPVAATRPSVCAGAGWGPAVQKGSTPSIAETTPLPFISQSALSRCSR